MKIVINTQYRENYGWCDGNIGENARWKYKGGSTYIVPVTMAQAVGDLAAVVDSVRHLVEHASDACEEYILEWSLEDDCTVVCEEWETPTVFSLADGVWSARKIHSGYYETWTCGAGPFDRENYFNSYVASQAA